MSLRLRLNLLLLGLTLCAVAGALPLLRPDLPSLLETRLSIPPSRVGMALLGTGVCLAGLLLWHIHARLLRPVRHLVRELGGAGSGARTRGADDITVLTARARRLHEKMQRAEAQLEESNENLRQTEKLALVGKLAAGVAHSIRNPLTGVKLRLFSLAKGLSLTPRQQEDWAAINDAIKHMEAIAANFLEFSRRPRLSIAQINISDVIDGTLSLLKLRLESFQVHVYQHRPDNMPSLNADAEQLREALANLIINACEAMGVGGVLTITEECGQLDPLGKVVVVRIADSGPGIPEDLQQDIFQPFISTKAEGTGLGLPIAKRIFEEHGGWLHLHCMPGKGATFVGVLPVGRSKDVWTRS